MEYHSNNFMNTCKELKWLIKAKSTGVIIDLDKAEQIRQEESELDAPFTEYVTYLADMGSIMNKKHWIFVTQFGDLKMSQLTHIFRECEGGGVFDDDTDEESDDESDDESDEENDDEMDDDSDEESDEEMDDDNDNGNDSDDESDEESDDTLRNIWRSFESRVQGREINMDDLEQIRVLFEY